MTSHAVMSDRSVQLLRERLRARPRRSLAHAAARPAAVLVPLLGDSSDPDVVLFERSLHMLEHKGEICFPGGSLEPEDEGPIEAALREANEELALAPRLVRVLGLLDDVATNVSNYTITPVVGHVQAAPQLVPDRLEVARVIRVPLSRLFDPG